MFSNNWRNNLTYLEDTDLQISTKDAHKEKRMLPPKIKGKHYTNMDYLVNAELIWLTPNFLPSCIYKENSDDSYFQQCFRTSEKLGEGSYGSVIKVQSLDDNKLYAMKVSKEPFRNDFDRKLKVREVEHHRSLSCHPNVVTLYKAWEEDRFVFMQLELCRKTVAEGTPLPERSCWNVLADILQALDYIHESGRGHFDVKVDNILLGADNLYKLSDFGLMLKLGECKEFLKEGDSKYVAPELILGGTNKFTPKADIFSLGISILELAGNLELPNHGDVWSALRENKFPLAQTKHLSDDLFGLLMQMMAPDPAKRPSAKEILALPKVKAVVEQRQMLKFGTFIEGFNIPPIEHISSFLVSLACLYSLTVLQMLALIVSQMQRVDEPMETDHAPEDHSGTSYDTIPSAVEPNSTFNSSEADSSNNLSVATTSQATSGIETTCSAETSKWSINVSSLTDDSGFIGEASTTSSGTLHSFRSPLFASTPECPSVPEELLHANEHMGKRLRLMRPEQSDSSSSDVTGCSSLPNCPAPRSPARMSPAPRSPARMSPARPCPPPSQIFCDWVSLTSADRSMTEASVNKNRLHCPSESLLQYGISPLRLSKACKQEYQAKKQAWINFSAKLKVKRRLNFDSQSDTPLNLPEKRLKTMSPRNLAQSFSDENEESNS